MASLEEIVSSKDPKEIKKRRSTEKRMITTIQNHLAELLVKMTGTFDHAKIKRTRVLTNLANLKKNQESFDVIHKAYLHYREESKDETEEETLVLKEEKYYNDVVDKICDSLD